jgi:hypothetical protein
MASPSNPNTAPNNAAAAGEVTPGLAPLAPPAGAYFGRYVTPPFSMSTTLNSPGANFPNPTQDIVQQTVNELFVYWINGTPPNPGPGIPGYYLIILRQSFITSVAALMVSSNVYQGWMLYYVHTGTQLSQPTSGSLALLATSPNTGDQYASVRQGMTPKVIVAGSAPQPRYIEVTDQAPLNLPGWAVQNRKFFMLNTSTHDMNTAYWEFRQTTPWDLQTRYIGSGDSQNTWWAPFFIDNAIAPIPDISHSSLSVTNYATWMVTNSAWTQDTPPTCQVQGQTTMNGDTYFLYANDDYKTPFNYSFPPGPWNQTNPLNAVAGSFTLQLDQIVQQT